MPLTQQIATIRSAFNQSTAPFAAQVAAWFLAHPDIVVQSVDAYRPDSTYRADNQVLRIAYLQATGSSIGGTWESLFYQTGGGVTAQAQFNTAFTPPATPGMVPVFILDLTDHERNKTGAEALLIVGMRTDVAPLGEVGYDRAAFIASPIADIAAGASGNALILDGSGRTVSISLAVTNLGSVAWVAGQRNYVIYDEGSGVYVGLPSCSGAGVWAPPVATTTTAYPCPAYFDDPVPTTTYNPPATTTVTYTTTTSTSTSTTTYNPNPPAPTTSTTTTTTTTTTSLPFLCEPCGIAQPALSYNGGFFVGSVPWLSYISCSWRWATSTSVEEDRVIVDLHVDIINNTFSIIAYEVFPSPPSFAAYRYDGNLASLTCVGGVITLPGLITIPFWFASSPPPAILLPSVTVTLG